MMAFNLGSVASMQRVTNPAGTDVSTYIYVIALLAFIAVIEGIILMLRLKRRD
jgi:hypothetical protein